MKNFEPLYFYIKQASNKSIIKNYFSFFSTERCCGYSKEWSSQCFEQPKQMLKLMDKIIFALKNFVYLDLCQGKYCHLLCWTRKLILAHWIVTSEILPLARKSYLTHAILPRPHVRDKYIGCTGTHAHGCQVMSLLCQSDIIITCHISRIQELLGTFSLE